MKHKEKIMKKIETKLNGQFLELFNNSSSLSNTDSDFLQDKRKLAIDAFKILGFPSNKNENWRKTDLSKTLEMDYVLDFESKERNTHLKSMFECDINDFDTDLFTILNGWCLDNNPIIKQDNGLIIAPINKVQQEFPKLFNTFFGKLTEENNNGLIALNTAFFTDGYFIYVPENMEVERTIQMVNLIDSEKKIFSNTRNLVVLGRNAKLKLVHCDDSLSSNGSFVNTVTEIFVDDGAHLDYYKLQNKDEHATVMTNNFIRQGRDSSTRSNTITLNGGLIRNETNVKLAGQGSHADIFGLYLVDKEQFVDNHVFVDHMISNCTSTQLFKGIADEKAKVVFNGHILVRQDAQRTEAFQNNNNIQLTDTVSIDTHPFLEIYADDVKCSHGATVGQLDTDALFYMMQRGICERTAKMLLMFSFTQEVVNKIKLPILKERIEDLITRRLKGELSACENCALSCDDPDAVITFDIDISKI